MIIPKNTTWLIKNGRILDPANNIDRIGDLAIKDGRIGLTDQLTSGEVEVIDATGFLVVPGLIDMHVHLREPGQ